MLNNAERLAAESPQVQEQYALTWERNQILDRSLQVAAGMIASALRGEKVEMPGKPAKDAPEKDWVDWFIVRGAMNLREEGVIG